MALALDHAAAKARREALHRAQVAAASEGLPTDPGLAALTARAQAMTAAPAGTPGKKQAKRPAHK